MRNFLLSFAVLFVTACSSSGPVVDYDTGYNFSGIQSFSVLVSDEAEAKIVDRRLEAAITQSLQSNGWLAIDDEQADNADIKVRFSHFMQEQPNNQRMTIGLGTGSYGRSGGVSVGGSVNVPVGDQVKNYQTIQIEFISDTQIVWRGSSSARVNLNNAEQVKQVQEALITDILRQFPPGKAQAQ